MSTNPLYFVHFGRWDDNACPNPRRTIRRVSTKAGSVTCPRCLRRYWQEPLVLSAQGIATLETIQQGETKP